MKKLLVIVFVLIGAPLLLIKQVKAQSNQPLAEFSKIKADGNAIIELIFADRYSVYSEQKPNADIEVENGVLKISGNGIYKVYTKSIRAIDIDGAVQLKCKDTIIADDLIIELDGVSKADVIIKSNTLKAEADGTASLTLSGTVSLAAIEADGVAAIRAEKLTAKSATIKTDGVSMVRIHVTTNLTVNADGTSTVRFSGNPEFKNLNIDGASIVKSIDNGEEFNEQRALSVERDDTTKIRFGSKKFMIIDSGKDSTREIKAKKGMKNVYAGFELGIGSFITPDFAFTFDNNYKPLNTRMGNSWFFGLNLFEFDGHIIKNKLAVTTGFGMTWSNYRFDGDNYLTPNNDSIMFTASNNALTQNKLYTYDLNAPVMIKFAPGRKGKSDKGFHIATGLIFRYITTMQVRTESTANGYKQKVKIEDDFNINPFKVDATIRIGFDKIKVFANYSLTPYFSQNSVPDVRTFSAGVTLIGF